MKWNRIGQKLYIYMVTIGGVSYEFNIMNDGSYWICLVGRTDKTFKLSNCVYADSLEEAKSICRELLREIIR